jgi:hypothetical protein
VTVRRIAPGQRAAPFAYWRRWLVPHLVLAATILFCLTPGPVYLGVWISKPSIDKAQRNWTSPPPSTRPVRSWQSVRWVGLYPVDGYYGLWAFRRGPVMNVINASELGGFVYSPAGPPAEFRRYALHYLGSGWYSFHQTDVYEE